MSDGVLHNGSGPAVSYDGDWHLWALNGVRVPQWLVDKRDTEIDPSLVSKIDNAQVRREFVRKVGIERIASALQARIVAKSGDGMYELLELNIAKRPWKYLKMRNPSLSTPGNEVWHLEGVDNGCQTIASAMLYRLNGDSRHYRFAEDGDNWWIHGDVLIVPEDASTLKPEPVAIA